MVELVEHQCDGQQETERAREAQMDSSQFEETGASEVLSLIPLLFNCVHTMLDERQYHGGHPCPKEAISASSFPHRPHISYHGYHRIVSEELLVSEKQ